MGISENEKSNFQFSLELKTAWRDVIIPPTEIAADDENFIWTDDGVFYKGRRVILYIRDQAQYYGYFNKDIKSEYKFHITGCQTLRGAIKKHQYEKYVVSNDTSGNFKVNIIRDNLPIEIETELHVCKFCLKKLNWKNYNKIYSDKQKEIIYKNFSIEEFFKTVSNDNQTNFSIIPEYTAKTAPLNIYPENWALISKVIRTERGYICEDCHRKINPPNLHVHHRNGLKNDCSRSNLEVLCADCHQKRHNHKILGSKRNNFRGC